MIDLTGKSFGRLRVIAKTERRSPSGGAIIWKCECSCSKRTVCFLRSSNLLADAVHSCGCLRIEALVARNTTQKGLSRHPLYNCWSRMRSRCGYPNDPSYKNYGGRGIEVCLEWRESFQKFFAWSISAGWESGLTIERVNNNGGYEPSNCKWIPRPLQLRNTRRCRLKAEQIGDIKARLAHGERIIDIAKDLRVPFGTISEIKRGNTWKDIEASR
jgi:hypothetical protein